MASSSQSAEEAQHAKLWSKSAHCSVPSQNDVSEVHASPIPSLDLDKIEVRMNNLEGLSNRWRSLPDQVKVQFEEKYGRIATLMRVKVQIPALKAMLSVWNPEYGVFSFNDIDTVPTMEEYQALLGIPYSLQNRIYLHLEHRQTWKRLTHLLGIPSEEAKSKEIVKGNTHGWYWTYLEKRLDLYLQEKQWDQASVALALGIYGLILFPGPLGIITCGAVEVFWTVERQGINPMPAILAETLLTLTHCRRQGKGFIKCCSQLLYLWIISHVCPVETKRLTWYLDQPPIERMTRLVISLENEQQWWERILSFNGHNYCWRKLWTSGQPVLIGTGGNQAVSLIGITGYTSYTPALVMRQFGSTQSMINIKEYHQGHFYHELKEEEGLKMARKSWENITLMERSPKGPSASGDYLKWRADRDREHSTVEFKDSNPRQNALLEVADNRLVDSLRKANTENSQLQERMKQLEDQQQKLKRRVRKLKEEARAERMGFEEQEVQWEKERDSLRAEVKETKGQNSKLQERMKYQEVLVEEYKQENKKKKLELKEQALLINDILKECAKERK
ncbi:hypothetical protein P3X46_024597 [Hevea brasiliensis]|uniref:DUF7745 domain-containing protein n=1 Tax=Hevea brasiliensis TaxID=3981 RepID=A0ABQ9L4H5_HEVBR|nr:hypothetical protein P3X46_024597 [Hevea brasiliensis]